MGSLGEIIYETGIWEMKKYMGFAIRVGVLIAAMSVAIPDRVFAAYWDCEVTYSKGKECWRGRWGCYTATGVEVSGDRRSEANSNAMQASFSVKKFMRTHEVCPSGCTFKVVSVQYCNSQ